MSRRLPYPYYFHVQNFCIHVRTFVRFSMFSDYVILTHHAPRASIFERNILDSVWDLNMGSIQGPVVFMSKPGTGIQDWHKFDDLYVWIWVLYIVKQAHILNLWVLISTYGFFEPPLRTLKVNKTLKSSRSKVVRIFKGHILTQKDIQKTVFPKEK